MLIATNDVFREIINGTWFLLNLYMVGVFFMYILPEIRGNRKWFAYGRNQAALGLMFYFIGGTFYHGLAWFLLAKFKGTSFNELFSVVYVIELLSVAFVFIGSALCIKNFSEKRWGNYALLLGVVMLSTLVLYEVIF